MKKHYPPSQMTEFLLWISRVIPPVLVLWLIRVPLDIASAWLWGFCFMLSVISIASIVWRLTLYIWPKRYRTKHQFHAVQYLRPVLMILAYFTADYCRQQSLASADRYGLDVASQMQAECDKAGHCPQRISEWHAYRYGRPGENATRHGEYGTSYKISYEPTADAQGFTIEVRHNIDESLFITGGVGQKVKWDLRGGDE